VTSARSSQIKVPVHTVEDLGLSGASDEIIIGEAISKKCLIVTHDRKFVDLCRNHEYRKGKDWRYFYGLIFLSESTLTAQLRQLKLAFPKIKPQRDNLVNVSPSGIVTVENLEGKRL
jgi:hypothetical protein